MTMQWQHWVFLLFVFLLGAWVGTKYPQVNLFNKLVPSS